MHFGLHTLTRICILGNFVNKLRLQGVSCIEIAPGPPPYKVAAYVRGTKVNNYFSSATDMSRTIGRATLSLN